MEMLVARLKTEHRSLEKLANLLDNFPVDLARTHPTIAEATLLVDVLSYLTQFPDVHHHPVEDRMVESLRAIDALPVDLGEEIERQHSVLARQGKALMRDLESAARQETASWPQLPLEIRLYAERLRHNMAVEELALFPLVVAALTGDDARAIDTHILDAPHDPLFVDTATARFADLRRIIAAESDCGCMSDPAAEPKK